MKTSARAIAHIKAYEGFRTHAYRCSAGVWTVGYGHTSDARYPVNRNTVVDEATANDMLVHDILEAEKVISQVVKVPLNSNQYGALVSLIFNIGEGNFRKSTLLKQLNAKNYEGASRQFGVWNKAHVYNSKTGKAEFKVLDGLTRRRAAEKALFNTPASLKDKPLQYPQVDGASEETEDARDSKGAVHPNTAPVNNKVVGGGILAMLMTIGQQILDFFDRAKQSVDMNPTVLLLAIAICAIIGYVIYTKFWREDEV